MKVSYRQAAADDVVRQFRYYLLTLDRPDVANRIRHAVRITMQLLRRNPFVGSRYLLTNPQLKTLRTWPVAGFEAIRIYYVLDEDKIHVIRILHGKRDVQRILEDEPVL